ncbi:4-hydroxyphenylacetaldehyde oxime monooxygenase-like [Setaria italica]|uniref:4-hydroxyphenylacetaldehyde oxime monooxygenase-like n=1 Tax=Setaria italica TaxID=4555 RepID=UPI000646A553|nr:4-hydroxyphenylacetaldehyde oxime monooxygenase-like [Setaria italica]
MLVIGLDQFSSRSLLQQQEASPPRGPPPPAAGPQRLPVLGNLHQIMGALPHRSLRELARRHGPVMQLMLGTVPTVVVSSAEAAREVLKPHDSACCSQPVTPGARRLSYGHKDVAFAPYSNCWCEMRKLFIVELLNARRIQASAPDTVHGFALCRGDTPTPPPAWPASPRRSRNRKLCGSGGATSR